MVELALRLNLLGNINRWGNINQWANINQWENINQWGNIDQWKNINGQISPQRGDSKEEPWQKALKVKVK